MAISSLSWQVITVAIALASLLVFLPLAWVSGSLPTHSASLLLTLLAPLSLLCALTLFLPLYYAIYLEHYYLQNELGGFTVVLAPAVTALGAWILGIIDILRRRSWAWLVPIAPLPFVGTLVYGFVVRHKRPDGRPETLSLDSLLLAGAALALLRVISAGLAAWCDSTAELFALFGAGVALVTGVAGGLGTCAPTQPTGLGRQSSCSSRLYSRYRSFLAPRFPSRIGRVRLDTKRGAQCLRHLSQWVGGVVGNTRPHHHIGCCRAGVRASDRGAMTGSR